MSEIVFKQNYCHASHISLVPAAVPLRKFTIIYCYQIISGMVDQLKFIGKAAENIIALLHQKLFMATAVGNCAGKVAFPGHLYLKKKIPRHYTN